MIKGIDVSRWQGIINWHLVKQNVQFAIIKIGGSDQGFYADGMAVRNVLEARSQGIPIGFYVYLGGASLVEDEVKHIKNLIHNIGGVRPGEVFCLDWEEHHNNEVAYVKGIAKGLIDAGLKPPMIYMSLSRVRGNNWAPLVAMNCALWVAAWGDNDAVPEKGEVPGSDEWPHWAMWQYSSTGTVPGISGRVDLNQFNGSVEVFKKYGTAGRGVTMPSPVNSSRVVIGTSTTEYVVKAGDSLSVIAAQWGKSWQQLWDLNRDKVSSPDRIFPGQKLRVWSSGNKSVAQKPTATHFNPHVRTYEVVHGDSLSGIAAKFGLSSWHLLWEANRNIISDPDLIRPGQKLRIP